MNSILKNISSDFSNAIKVLYKTKGKIIFSGLGKSGHIAKKISSTFSSIGSPSIFIHPTEANHGDLGIIKKSDSTPEWHSNESGAYRANIYIETSNYNSVDLMFTTDEISRKKLLIIDTDKNNVIIWDDRKIQHRTPKNILDENFPRSFIYISLIPTHNYNYNNRNKPFNKFKSNKTVNESYVQ